MRPVYVHLKSGTNLYFELRSNQTSLVRTQKFLPGVLVNMQKTLQSISLAELFFLKSSCRWVWVWVSIILNTSQSSHTYCDRTSLFNCILYPLLVCIILITHTQNSKMLEHRYNRSQKMEWCQKKTDVSFQGTVHWFFLLLTISLHLVSILMYTQWF